MAIAEMTSPLQWLPYLLGVLLVLFGVGNPLGKQEDGHFILSGHAKYTPGVTCMNECYT